MGLDKPPTEPPRVVTINATGGPKFGHRSLASSPTVKPVLLTPSTSSSVSSADPGARIVARTRSLPRSSELALGRANHPVAAATGTSKAVGVDEDPNGGLMALKAFSLATLYVWIGATITVFGVRSYLGVNTVRYLLFLTCLHC